MSRFFHSEIREKSTNQSTNDRADLDASIAALQDAVDGAPSDADLLPRYLNDLGRVLTELSYRSDSTQGLARAVEVWTRAQSLLDARFDSVGTSYQLGERSLSTELGLAERIVSVYLELAERVATPDGGIREASHVSVAGRYWATNPVSRAGLYLGSETSKIAEVK